MSTKTRDVFGFESLPKEQLLIGAGLFLGSKHTDGFYIKWVVYAKVLKRRRLTWTAAREAAAIFIKRNPDYPNGRWQKWQKRESAWMDRQEKKGKR